MTHKRTSKLLTKLVIASAVVTTLPLATNTKIHADSVGIQQAVTTTVQQTANKTNSLVEKDNRVSHSTPEPTPSSHEEYSAYIETGEDISPAIDPFSFFVFGIGGASLITLIILAIGAVEESFEKKSSKAPTEERRNTYEAR